MEHHSHVGCSSIINMTSSSGSFSSPLNGPDSVRVCWLIVSQTYIRFSFSLFRTGLGHGFVRAYGGEEEARSPLLLDVSGESYGYDQHTVVSPTERMLVVFATDSANTYLGFTASYSSCSVLTSTGGSISSTNPEWMTYNNWDSICWLIRQPAGRVASLTFSYLDTEFGYDYVRVFDGHSANSPQLLSASGNSVQSAVTSSSNEMLVVFTSDNSWVFKGFQANYTSSLKYRTEDADDTTIVPILATLVTSVADRMLFANVSADEIAR